MKKLFFALVILCFYCNISIAQFVFNRIQTVEVRDTGNRALPLAWAGGLNNPQFSEADLNNDGELDLVVFNRANILDGDKLLTFIFNGTGYEYAPEYEINFPTTELDSPRIEYWMLMSDFDCDGIEDIYACTPGYIQFYKGSYDANNKIDFTYKTFFQFNSFSGLLNLFVSSIDIPAIADINNDGDLDVLTFNIFGFVLEYYENQSQELTGTCGDTILFELVDDCWGNIYESGLRKSVDIKDTCGSIVTPRLQGGIGNTRHTGSTVALHDVDGDLDQDLFLGDISFPNINYIQNDGTPDSVVVLTQDTIFPDYNISVDMSIYPAVFFIDVNRDGKKDMIVSPNAPKKSKNYTCAWYYENTSPNIKDTFELANQAYLVSDMIDVGEGSYPVFVDVNQDSLIDILIGNYGYFINGVDYKTSIAYFQNIGTKQFPIFKLITRDAFNFSSLGILNMSPAFADLDNDGDLDMMLGEEDGQLNYFTNTAGAGNPLNFNLTTPSYQGIDVGQYSTPYFFDIDGDSLLDMVVGERSGNLNYFKNTGTDTSFNFTRNPTNGFFGKVDVRVGGQITGFSAPVISRLDTTNTLFLLSGTESKGIVVYKINTDSLNAGEFSKVFDTYSGIHEGERNTLSIANLNGDNKLEMIVGNYRGGLGFFSQGDSILEPLAVINFEKNQETFVAYPNPSKEIIYLRFKNLLAEQDVTISVYNSLTQQVYSKEYFGVINGATLPINIVDFESGIYFLQVKQADILKTVRVIKY